MYKEEKKAVGENQYNNVKTELKEISATVSINNPTNEVNKNSLGNSYQPTLKSKPNPTSQKIAEQTNVTEKTVRNAEKFADAVDTVAKATGISPQKILSDEVKATQIDIKFNFLI